MDLIIHWNNAAHRFDTLDDARLFILSTVDEDHQFEISVSFVKTHITRWLQSQEITAFLVAELPTFFKGSRTEDDVLRRLPPKARQLIGKYRDQVGERRTKILERWEGQINNTWLLGIPAKLASVLRTLIDKYGLEYDEFVNVVNREVLDRLAIVGRFIHPSMILLLRRSGTPERL